MAEKIDIISTNRKALFNYEVIEKFEAGMILKGSEVKSLREKKITINESFVSIKSFRVFLMNAHISEYSHTGFSGHDPLRVRELLLNKKEIIKLQNSVMQKGLTIIPLKAYFKGGKAKIEIALGRGKKNFQKKESLKNKDLEREASRELKRRR
jgi:SsrA-binding protein